MKNLPNKENYIELIKQIPEKYRNMRRSTVHIITKNFFLHDATSRSVLEQAIILDNIGFNIKIYAENTSENLKEEIVNKDQIKNINPEELILFHYSIQDKFLTKILNLPNKKILYYHGITPPQYLPTGSSLYYECLNGLKEITNFTFECNIQHIFSNSQYCLNEFKTLSKLNVSTSVIPPMISLNNWDNIKADEKFKQKKEHPKFLYVGRKFPHKNIENVIEFFKQFRKKTNKGFLILAGAGYDPHYYLPIKEAALEDKTINENILFYETLTNEQLKSLYINTDYVITFSLHEGFCVPLIESAKFKKKIITHKSTALEETALYTDGIIVDENQVNHAVNLTIDDYENPNINYNSKLEYNEVDFLNQFINVFIKLT